MSEEPLVDELEINNRIERFQSILEGHENEKVIVQKYIVHGTPYVFKDDEGKYFDLKCEIANFFSRNYKINEHYNNIHMVGSAKIGFSIAPKKLWKPFSLESDIDIAIISTRLFEHLEDV